MRGEGGGKGESRSFPLDVIDQQTMPKRNALPGQTDRQMEQKLPRKTQITSSKGHMAGLYVTIAQTLTNPQLTTCK